MTTGRLLLGMALVLAAITAGGQTSTAKKKPNVNKLQGELNQLRGEKSRITRQLRQTRAQAGAVRVNLKQVDERLSELEGSIAATSSSLQKNVVRQRTLAQELEESESAMASTKEQVRKRLRAIYMQGNGSFLSVMMGTNSVGDLMGRAGMMREIAAQDRKLFDRYTLLVTRISAKKRQQDQVVAEVRELRNRQERYEDRLKSTRSEKEVALRELRSKQVDLERALREYVADENAIAAQIRAYYRSLKRPGAKPVPRYTGRFGRPVNAPITSRFGMRFHPILRRTRLHAGVDYGAPHGTPIMAAADGVVISASYSGGYGNRVIIDHGGGISTTYAHCSRMFVRAGQSVKRGERIAAVGSTGLSTGPHLHFEVRVNGRPVNPLGY